MTGSLQMLKCLCKPECLFVLDLSWVQRYKDRMGGWVDGWMGGWVDGWMDGFWDVNVMLLIQCTMGNLHCLYTALWVHCTLRTLHSGYTAPHCMPKLWTWKGLTKTIVKMLN